MAVLAGYGVQGVAPHLVPAQRGRYHDQQEAGSRDEQPSTSTGPKPAVILASQSNHSNHSDYDDTSNTSRPQSPRHKIAPEEGGYAAPSPRYRAEPFNAKPLLSEAPGRPSQRGSPGFRGGTQSDPRTVMVSARSLAQSPRASAPPADSSTYRSKAADTYESDSFSRTAGDYRGDRAQPSTGDDRFSRTV